jgi:hypothetical protein
MAKIVPALLDVAIISEFGDKAAHMGRITGKETYS